MNQVTNQKIIKNKVGLLKLAGASTRQYKGTEGNGTYLSLNVGWVKVFRVTHQALRSNTKTLLTMRLAARLMGYGANNAPNPSYFR